MLQVDAKTETATTATRTRPWRWRLFDGALKGTYAVIAWATRRRVGPAVSVSAFVLRDRKVLLLDRRDGQGVCLPGGIVYAYEQLEVAVEREVFEETGYTVAVGSLLGVYGDPGRDPRFHAITIVYEGGIVGGRARDSHEGRVSWQPISDLANLNFAFDHNCILFNCMRLFIEENSYG